MKLLSVLSALILCCSLTTWAQSEPEEQTTASIRHDSSSGNMLTGDVSKNLMKTITASEHYTVQVPYQGTEEYTVDIPYQTTEDYTVDIPYTDTETYTDYETRYRTEYRCHDVTRTRYECNNVTRYRQQCHNEVQCHQVTGNPTCHDVTECGTNALGQPICKTRQVCEGGSSSQVCDNRNVCENVPYTDQQCGNVPYTDQQCANEQVSYQEPVTRTRQVTKYRQETRTRTVTKTRQETRTRTVTLYRDEDRCCKNVQHTVFDRQLQFHVEVNFPTDAVVAPGQVETMDIVLVAADAKTASVALQNVVAKNRYYIAKQQVIGASIRVDLAIQPKDVLSDGDVAVLSDNSKLAVTVNPLKYSDGTITIVDSVPAFRDVVSSYTVTLAMIKVDGSLLEGASRTWSAAELKAANGTLRLIDVYTDQTKALNSLGLGSRIKWQVVAKRGGASPILVGKSVQAVQEGQMQIK